MAHVQFSANSSPKRSVSTFGANFKAKTLITKDKNELVSTGSPKIKGLLKLSTKQGEAV